MSKFHILPCYENAFANQVRTIACCGTAGSGKSKFFAFKTLFRVLNEKKPFRALCVRKVKEDIRESVFANLVEVITDLGWHNAFKITESPMRIKSIVSGNDIIFRGIDEPNKLKSINGIKHIWVEEAIELNEQDYDQLQYRLRGYAETYKQVCLTFNPATPDHWIKKRFFDKVEPNSYVFNTTFEENPYLDNGDKEQMKNNAKGSKQLYDNLTLGIWAEQQTGYEFYHEFRSTEHICECEYDAEYPLHISLDFNVHPYCTLLIAQVIGQERRFLDEICLTFPKSNTHEICYQFKQWADAHSTNPIGLFIYGDPAGAHVDTRNGLGGDDFGILRYELRDFKPVLRVAKAAPSVKKRGEWLNRILSNAYDLRIGISPKCANLIQDLLNVKQDVNGTKLKLKHLMESGIVCEKYGHTSDAFDYLLCEADKASFTDYAAPKARFAPIYKSRREMSIKKYGSW